MTPISNLQLVTQDATDPRTLHIRRTDARVWSWAATQAWTFDGGDAIVIVAGHLPRVDTYVVLRLGDVVRVVEAVGLVAAYNQFSTSPDLVCSHCDGLLEFQGNCSVCCTRE